MSALQSTTDTRKGPVHNGMEPEQKAARLQGDYAPTIEITSSRGPTLESLKLPNFWGCLDVVSIICAAFSRRTLQCCCEICISVGWRTVVVARCAFQFTTSAAYRYSTGISTLHDRGSCNLCTYCRGSATHENSFPYRTSICLTFTSSNCTKRTCSLWPETGGWIAPYNVIESCPSICLCGATHNCYRKNLLKEMHFVFEGR